MATQVPNEPSTNPGSGLVGNFKRVKHDGGASLQELRDFVAKMRGRSPQEVLGMISASDLIRATIQATIAVVIVMAIFTIGPYYWSGETKTAKKATPAVAEPSDTPSTSTPTPGADKAAEVPAATTDPDPAKAAKALNIDETKTADPNVNPLDKDIDKLLDGK